jgi:type VI secretion system protein ImpH
MLADYFDVEVEVESFIGAWRKIEDQDQCFLTDEKLDSTALGSGVIVGDEVWDQQSRVRVRIGPLSAERYQEFLPTGSAWAALQSLIRVFSRNDLEYEICPVLRRDDVPPCKMTSDTTVGTMLGWNTWLNSRREFDHDADETLILLLET